VEREFLSTFLLLLWVRKRVLYVILLSFSGVLYGLEKEFCVFLFCCHGLEKEFVCFLFYFSVIFGRFIWIEKREKVPDVIFMCFIWVANAEKSSCCHFCVLYMVGNAGNFLCALYGWKCRKFFMCFFYFDFKFMIWV
jgi:hypothetical protein